jgi:tetratricopeptide (TPR) repeat protein
LENNLGACRVLAQCHNALQRPEQALQALLRSFAYDAPRAELCCELGYYYFARQEYEKAVQWYRTALLCPKKEDSGAFLLEDCYGYLPHLQMCVCLDRLGRAQEAVAHNEEAAKLRPRSAAVKHNREYFAGKK